MAGFSPFLFNPEKDKEVLADYFAFRYLAICYDTVCDYWPATINSTTFRGRLIHPFMHN